MSRTKRYKKRKAQPATTQTTYPLRAVQHAARLAQDFAKVYEHIEKSKNQHSKLPQAINMEITKGVESVVAQGLLKRVCPSFSTKQDKTTFQSLISTMIRDLLCSTIPQSMFDALNQSFRHLVPKIQALELASQHFNWYPATSKVSTRADPDADALPSVHAVRLSADDEIADSIEDASSENEKETSTQVQPTMRLQGSVDFSPDQSDLESDEESGKGTEVEIKEENEKNAAALVLSDPTVFTLTLGVPIAADDHRFSIRFNNKRVVDGLESMPSSEVWQLVHDAIQQDPEIPNLTSSLPRVTEVHQQDDGRLAFRLRTEEDLELLSTKVQWARNFRDAVSAGIKTYKVVFQLVKIRTMKMNTDVERALIIDQIREENSEKIPPLNLIGAIGDVMMLQDLAFDPAHQRKRHDCADYLLVFGSREAANAAMDTGLFYRKKSRKCVIYAPGEQWHQQCSHCQGHSHTAKDCRSTALSGRCGYKHATQYCTSATIECANCHGEHVASSKKCLKWLKAKEKEHRSHRFAAEEDSEAQTATPAKSATFTLPPPALPLSVRQKTQETLNNKPEIYLPSPELAATTIPPAAARIDTSVDIKAEPTTPSALLQTVDEFRAFVAARKNNQNSRKRKEPEYLMTGALQANEHDGKRVKRVEEEGPVWPIGHKGYQPPSLKAQKSVD